MSTTSSPGLCCKRVPSHARVVQRNAPGTNRTSTAAFALKYALVANGPAGSSSTTWAELQSRHATAGTHRRPTMPIATLMADDGAVLRRCSTGAWRSPFP